MKVVPCGRKEERRDRKNGKANCRFRNFA